MTLLESEHTKNQSAILIVFQARFRSRYNWRSKYLLLLPPSWSAAVVGGGSAMTTSGCMIFGSLDLPTGPRISERQGTSLQQSTWRFSSLAMFSKVPIHSARSSADFGRKML